MSKVAIRINPKDTVAVALANLCAGEEIAIEAQEGAEAAKITLAEDITQGHKFALSDIKKGEAVIKYGYPIGEATADIAKGCHVHTHNIKTRLSEEGAYSYDKAEATRARSDWAKMCRQCACIAVRTGNAGRGTKSGLCRLWVA